MKPGIDVLLIEDEPSIAEAIRFILSREGWRCAQCSEGSEAIQQILGLRPRLVILDVMLPGRDGLQVLAQLRATPEIASTPVLVLTAQGGPLAAEGASMVLAKPFANEDLRQAVSSLMPTGHPGA